MEVIKLNKRINVYIMYIIVFLQGFVFYGPIATIYRQNRGLSLSSMFLIESISWILMILFEIPWGWFADRFGYKKTLIISNFTFFISKIVFYKAYSFPMFFLERVLLSLSLAGISGCDIALLYSSIEENESEKVFGRYNAIATAGFLIASFISTALIKISLDSTAFWTIIPYGIAVVFTFFIKDVEIYKEEKPILRESISRVIKNKEIIFLVISASLINEVVQAVSVFLNQKQYIRCGIPLAAFGILTAFMQIVRLSSAKVHKFTDKLGRNKIIGTLYMIITVSCIILILTRNAGLSIIAVALICASSAIVSPIIAFLENKNIKTKDRATILSLYAMCGDLVAAGANIVVGKTADVSLNMAFITCILLSFMAFILFLVYKKNVSMF